ncbi:radical SAM protein [Candidatus Desantisbacteria bacterium]|nr:radical SAM protein [Candidatus Desantisbacteria bacterium]
MPSKLSYYYEMYHNLNLLNSTAKAWNYLKYRSMQRKAVMSLKRYTPQIACLCVTMRCNLKCGYCAAAKILQKEKDKWRESEATLPKVRQIFTNPLFSNCLLVDLQGGEPLLVNDFDRIVSYLAKRGHIINTSTNGLLLADRITDLKRAGISRINVSLYDANRPVIERDLAKINQIFPVHMSFVLLRSQVEKEQEELIKIARFIHDAGCRSLRFWLYRPMGIDPQPKEIISDNLPSYIEFRRRMEEVLPNFCLWPVTIQTGKVKKLCPQLWQRVTCDISGNMVICCGIDKTLEGPCSNLFDSESEKLINHPTLVKMREQLLDPLSDPPEACKTCNLLGESGW